ncbi:MAG: hypothetical protein P3X22_007975 [Thermoprotei archaeon]|nr:hypothetical protein [Thermoprotei archaeon]
MDLWSFYPVLVLIHVLAATMWVGAHLILVTGPLVKTIKSNDVRPTLEFYSAFIWPATIALIIGALTGVILAQMKYPPNSWLEFGEPSGRIGEKMALFMILILVSGYAHMKVIPIMRTGGERAVKLTVIYGLVATILSLGFPVLGIMIRFEW